MTYSDVLISYHRIKLSRSNANAVDIFFTGAGQHLLLWKMAVSGSWQEQFHDERFRAHLKALMEVVFTGGDFSVAIDPTEFGLQKRENWSWESGSILHKDPRMFNSLPYDNRFTVGETHPNDTYLP